MRHLHLAPCLAALLALAACTGTKDVTPDTTVTCGSASECPGGRVCNRGFCVNPNLIDTTPPDLAGPVHASQDRVRAGQPLTVTFRATEPLDHNGTSMSLALVPPAFLDCAPTSSVDWRCTYTVTGHENGDLGGDIGIDVRMRDLSGNDTARSAVASVTFDFVPPVPTLATVGYYPGATNPLPSVAAATAGTGVRVAVSASELLSATAPPALVGRSGAATLRFELYAGGYGVADAVFATTVAAGQPDGDYALEVGWTDAVGNVGSAAVAGTFVHVKTSKPALAVNQAAVVFVRSPWGNGAAEDLGGYAVPAGPYFAIEPAEPLSGGAELPAGTFLLDGGALPERIQVKAGTMTVGTLFPQAGGTWRRQPLASPDTYTVQLVGYDAAGNASDPQPIGTVEWVATSNLPAIGESPHVVRRTPLVEPTRVQRSEVVAVSGPEVAGADRSGALATAQGVWRRMSLVGQGTRTIDQAGVAYDAARGRVVMFGGRFGSSSMQETYEWDGRQWLDLTPPAGSPSLRYLPALAYDGARGRVVLFGGEFYESGAYRRFAETWEWDGTAWDRRNPAASPQARSATAMAYDSARRRVVLFGGRDAQGNALGDTWEWDGTTWIPRTPAAPSPAARDGHTLVYDAARGRTVLVGGAVDGVVWEWNGSSWTPVTPALAPDVNQVVYARDPTSLQDPPRRCPTALGTYADGTGTHAAAWLWDGLSWTTITIPGAYPASNATSVAYDVARERAVLVVGGNSPGWSGTWEWDGASWRIVTPTGARPAARYMYTNALSYDSDRKRMVLFGGSAGSDTWEWDGNNWTSVAAAASSPYQYGAGPAYDPLRHRTVFYGASLTWEWNGSAWASVATANTPGGGPLVWDGLRQRVIAASHSGAYAWTGTDWSAVTAPPIGSTWSGVTQANGRVLLVAPSASAAQALFEWNGTEWVDVTPAGATPLPRDSPGLAYDSERARTILFGGKEQAKSVASQDTWEFDGSAWRDRTPDGTKPPGRRLTSLCYDPDRHRTVLFSGNDAGGEVYWDDTWELEARRSTRPAIQLDASMARAGIDPASIVRLHVRAWAGGAFTDPDPGAAGGAGTTLRGWANHSAATGPGGWERIATSQAGPPPWTGPLSATYVSATVGAADARRFITDRDRQLSFQVVPSGTMGPDPGGARVALDYVEVRVRYAAVP